MNQKLLDNLQAEQQEVDLRMASHGNAEGLEIGNPENPDEMKDIVNETAVAAQIIDEMAA